MDYLIIGGSSGIGRATSLSLSDAGHRVYATFKDNRQADQPHLLTYHHLDATASSLDLDFLPEKLDGLVYCPGSINLRPFHRLKPEQFLSDYDLQVVGAIKAIQAALPRLKKADNPSIVLFSTVAVQVGYPFHSQVAASKGAVEGLTKALAAEFAPSIRVNCIAPSLTDTPLAAKLLGSEEKKQANAQRHPLRKIGQAEDLAEMAAFLLSQKAGWVTGQIFHVDGGMSSLRV